MKRGLVRVLVSMAVALTLLAPTAAAADGHVVAEGVGVAFGLTTGPGKRLVVVDVESGLIELRNGERNQLAAVPGLTDAEVIGRGQVYATVGQPPEDAPAGAGSKVVRLNKNKVREVADLLAFETANNPDGGGVESNPFDLELLQNKDMLVADAAGNDLLFVTKRGDVDWVATFPLQDVSTDHLADFIPDLPPVLPAQAVPTSVAVGPDGHYYVGELTGFPGTPGASRVWRIAAGTRNAHCVDPGPGMAPVGPCEVVGRGFTSIIDIAFGPDGELLVVELSESGWLSVEFGDMPLPGTVNSLDLATGAVTELASLVTPTAVAVTKKGDVFATEFALDPVASRVVRVA